MYRLLFLFYIEARPDLGYAPMDSETYRKGYSLEHLRDLELVRLTIELPDELAKEARSHGLLAAGAVEAMIRKTLRRRAAPDPPARSTRPRRAPLSTPTPRCTRPPGAPPAAARLSPPRRCAPTPRTAGSCAAGSAASCRPAPTICSSSGTATSASTAATRRCSAARRTQSRHCRHGGDGRRPARHHASRQEKSAHPPSSAFPMSRFPSRLRTSR